MDGLLEELGARVLDTCELLHYLYPEMPSHSLEHIVRWAGVGGGAVHRAMQDAEDTFLAFSHALRRCIDESRQDDLAELISMLGPQPGQLSFDDAPEPRRELLEKLHAA